MEKASAIIQARINSTRLPGKVLKNIYNNLNSLDLIYLRLKKCMYLNKIIFAIPKSDTNLIDYLKNKNYKYFLGSETNVRDRYIKAAENNSIEKIVRVTSDCPLIDPFIVDECIKKSKKFEYISNNTPPDISDYANGSDVEVFSKDLLKLSAEIFPNSKDKEHVTFPFWDGRMKIKSFRMKKKISDKSIRITLDYKNDLIVLKKILESSKNLYINYDDIIRTYKSLRLDKYNGNYEYDAGWK